MTQEELEYLQQMQDHNYNNKFHQVVDNNNSNSNNNSGE